MSRRQPGLFDPTDDERRESHARVSEAQRRGFWALRFRHAAQAHACRALLRWQAGPDLVAALDTRRAKLPRTTEYAADLWCNAWRAHQRGDNPNPPAVLNVGDFERLRR